MQNSTEVDTFREPTPPPPPPTKKRKIAQLSSTVIQLKGIADTSYSTVEENEFEVFGKHVGLQLKSLPLLLALEAQEHIQICINRIRRQHLQNPSEQNGITGTPQSYYYATESPYSDFSTYYNDTSNYNLEEQANECFSSSILPTDNSEHVSDYQLSSNIVPSGHINRNETQSVTIISNDLILTAMQNANVNK